MNLTFTMNITGPVNIFRLQGNIDNINKTIYFLADFHLQPYEQTQCKKVQYQRILTFPQYLTEVNSLISKNQKIDVFIEHGKSIVPIKHLHNTYNFMIENRKTNNLININFHMFDFRKFTAFPSFVSVMNRLFQKQDDKLTDNWRNKILYHKYLNVSKKWLDIKNRLFTKNKSNKIFLKLFFKWKHENVKEKIVPQMINTLKQLDDNCEILKYEVSNSPIVNNIIEKYFDNIFVNQSMLIDYYLLRKILDRNEIKNAVVYTGAYHTIHCIAILVRDFNFKITHISSNNSSMEIEDIHKILKEAESNKELRDIFRKYFSNGRYQCSDISSFPPNFS